MVGINCCTFSTSLNDFYLHMGFDKQGHDFCIYVCSLILSDGTASARVVMSGQTVQCLLQLSDDEWSSLEKEVKKHGEIFIKQVNCYNNGHVMSKY